jgi:hypothetical protein
MTFASPILPLLGSSESTYNCFQYLPVDFDHIGIKIQIPNWASTRQHLTIDEIIHLHLTIENNNIESDFYFDHARVLKSYKDETKLGYIYEMEYIQPTRLRSTLLLSKKDDQLSISLDSFSGTMELLLHSIKECWLLKKGMGIYLKHFAAYFSRISDYPQHEYPLLVESLFNDIQTKIKASVKILADLLDECKSSQSDHSSLISILDLEQFKLAIEPELLFDLFSLSFSETGPLSYLKAIKRLEGKLYDHYNTVIVLYMTSL